MITAHWFSIYIPHTRWRYRPPALSLAVWFFPSVASILASCLWLYRVSVAVVILERGGLSAPCGGGGVTAL